MIDESFHIPVLTEEVIHYLLLKKNGTYTASCKNITCGDKVKIQIHAKPKYRLKIITLIKYLYTNNKKQIKQYEDQNKRLILQMKGGGKSRTKKAKKSKKVKNTFLGSKTSAALISLIALSVKGSLISK